MVTAYSEIQPEGVISSLKRMHTNTEKFLNIFMKFIRFIYFQWWTSPRKKKMWSHFSTILFISAPSKSIMRSFSFYILDIYFFSFFPFELCSCNFSSRMFRNIRLKLLCCCWCCCRITEIQNRFLVLFIAFDQKTFSPANPIKTFSFEVRVSSILWT